LPNPVSFEVFSDEFPEMRRQALKISTRVSVGGAFAGISIELEEQENPHENSGI
jgi:hypothetical protein